MMGMTEIVANANPAQGDVLLRISGLQGWYGDSQALFGVDLDVRRGEVVGLVGRNGAGKTSTLRACMGLLARTRGAIQLHGKTTQGMSPADIARLGVGYCPEERGIFTSLTVGENLSLPPVINADGMTLDEIMALFPNLGKRLRHYGGQLSGGEQQMLAIARILRTGAPFLIFDEPTEGLAPVIVQQIEAAFLELRRRRYTILLVEQNLEFVLRLSDRIVVLEHGAVVENTSTRDAVHARERLAALLAL